MHPQLHNGFLPHFFRWSVDGDTSSGGSGGTSDATKDTGGSSDTPPGSEDSEKGPAGGTEALKADLAAERARRHEAETSRDTFQAQLQQFLKALTGETPAGDAGDDPMAKIGELQRQIEERETRAKTQLIKAEVKSIANRLGFHDPADAMGQIDIEGVKVNDEGEVDSNTIETKLKEVAGKKPYLLKLREDASASDVGIGGRGEPKAENLTGKDRIAAGMKANSKTKVR